MALKCASVGRIFRVLLQEPDALLLLGPRIRQGSGEAGDREVRRRGAINDRRDDAGRHEGEGRQQADMPFALAFSLGDLGEGGNSTEPDVVDPSPGLGDCGEQGITALGLQFAVFAEGA